MRLLVVDNKTNRNLIMEVDSVEMLPDNYGKYWFKITETNNQTVFIHTSADFTENLYEYGRDRVIGSWTSYCPQPLNAETSNDELIPS